MSDKNKLPLIYQLLLNRFGYQGWWPIRAEGEHNSNYHPKDYSFPKNDNELFEICVGAILTQNTSWKNVETALLSLRRHNAMSPSGIKRLPASKLAQIIHSSGYHNQKAKKLKAFVDFYLNNKGIITRESLLNLWGIGPETADSMLLYGYKVPIFVVDAYTRRIMGRIGFKENSYGDIQKLFMENLPADHKIFNEYHALLVELGKNICKSKPMCNYCPLKSICKYGNLR
ncbi:MAG TPA: endonuclease III domain-containing protein [Candidatus Nanoarchaeia archaeon]|nr:endonuclease III domain-containing protein [Candidatus Nanoarchaeia archaeon]